MCTSATDKTARQCQMTQRHSAAASNFQIVNLVHHTRHSDASEIHMCVLLISLQFVDCTALSTDSKCYETLSLVTIVVSSMTVEDHVVRQTSV